MCHSRPGLHHMQESIQRQMHLDHPMPSQSDNPASLSPARYTWRLLRAGPLRLDGGSMFGLIPRVVWSKAVPTDEQGRITVAHNCLLLERYCDPINLNEASGILTGPRLVLIETGSGDKFDAKS